MKTAQWNFNLRMVAIIAFASTLGLGSCSSAPTNAEGKAFATEIVNSMKPDWNTKKVLASMDPTVNLSLVEKASSDFAKYLGPIQKVGGLVSSDFTLNVKAAKGEPDCIATYKSIVSCEKDLADVIVVVEHMNGKWLIRNFGLKSDIFKQLGKEDALVAEKLVELYVEKYATRYGPSNVQVAKECLAPGCTFGTSMPEDWYTSCERFRQMGNLEEITDKLVKDTRPDENGFAFTIAMTLNLEKGPVGIEAFVKKDNAGDWKINNLNVDFKNK